MNSWWMNSTFSFLPVCFLCFWLMTVLNMSLTQSWSLHVCVWEREGLYVGSKTFQVKQRISWEQEAPTLTCNTHIHQCSEPGNSSSLVFLCNMEGFVLSKWLRDSSMFNSSLSKKIKTNKFSAIRLKQHSDLSGCSFPKSPSNTARFWTFILCFLL